MQIATFEKPVGNPKLLKASSVMCKLIQVPKREFDEKLPEYDKKLGAEENAI